MHSHKLSFHNLLLLHLGALASAPIFIVAETAFQLVKHFQTVKADLILNSIPSDSHFPCWYCQLPGTLYTYRPGNEFHYSTSTCRESVFTRMGRQLHFHNAIRNWNSQQFSGKNMSFHWLSMVWNSDNNEIHCIAPTDDFKTINFEHIVHAAVND